jgi:hypothetical protein
MKLPNKYNITRIKKGKVNNLTVSWDSVDKEEKKKYAVLLYTPSMFDKMVHYHIELNRKEAKALNKWLEKFLKDTKK